MTSEIPQDVLDALKTAYAYMPHLADITSFEYGERCDKVREDVETVRGVLLDQGIDPDEVFDEINPDLAPNSSY